MLRTVVSLWHVMTSLHRITTQLSSGTLIMGPGEPEKKEKKKKSTRPVINYIETKIYTNKQKKKKAYPEAKKKKNLSRTLFLAGPQLSSFSKIK